jgi:hypothetical protein
MMKRLALAALISTIPFMAAAGSLSSSTTFEGNVSTPAKDGTAQTVHITIQTWSIGGRGYEQLPLRGFYVAHLLSGPMAVTMGEQAAEHLPGDYWAVEPGGTMQVKVHGDVAVLETIVLTKQ